MARESSTALPQSSAFTSLEPQGAKGEVVKRATKLLAKAIRHGGDEAAKVVRYLDKDAAKAFKKYAKSIADDLDRIAKIPDVTTRIVKENSITFYETALVYGEGLPCRLPML